MRELERAVEPLGDIEDRKFFAEESSSNLALELLEK